MRYSKRRVFAMTLQLLAAACSAQEPARAKPTHAVPEATVSTLDLAGYKLVLGPKVLAVTANSSGLAYDPSSQTLYMIINDPCQLVQMDVRGEIKRTIDLAGFKDTEAVSWIGGRRFVVAEEKRRRLVVFELTDKATSVPYTKSNVYSIEKTPPDNVGYEGVAYDKASHRLYIVKEKEPRKILVTELPAKKGPAKYVKNVWDIQASSLGMDDLSDVHFDPKTRHLLILSDESKCLVEATVDGREISRLSLKQGDAGLTESIPQPEGVTLDPDGNIYICSEPNLFYVFAPARKRP